MVDDGNRSSNAHRENLSNEILEINIILQSNVR